MNGYLLDIIFSTINNRIKKLSCRENVYKNNTNNNESIDLNWTKYFTIPFIISERFNTIASNNNFKVSYKPTNTLNRFIKLGKDKLDKMEQCDVVYKINCLDCNSSYWTNKKKSEDKN